MDLIRKLKQTLDSSGLTEEEISFYLSVLKKPQSSIFDIAKRSKLPKDQAYKIFDSLEDKKLLTANKEGKYKKIQAAPINSFVENLYKQGRHFYRSADSLKEIKPFLPLLSLPDQKGTFTNFTSGELAEQYMDMSYMPWENILAYGNFEMVIPIMGTDPDQKFVNKRLKRGKRAYPILSNPGDYSWKVVKNDYKEMRNTKIINNPKLNNYFVFIMPDINTTAMWVKDKDDNISGTTIESSIMTNLHENLFHYFDEIAEAQH